MKKIIKRLLLALCLIVLVMLILSVTLISVYVYVSIQKVNTYQATYSDSITTSQISSEITVHRDDNGVPHIYANNEEDAWYALGYVMAQDRLFQMDFYRRLSQGQISELLGPVAVKYDKVLRMFRLRKFAEEIIEKYGSEFEPIRAPFEAFIAGVNAFIQKGQLPPEFQILRYQPEPFTTIDCLTSAMIMPITFADGLRQDLVNLVLQMKYPDEDFSVLSCGYHRERPVTIMESIEEAEEYLRSQGRDLNNWGLPSAQLQLPHHKELKANLEQFLVNWTEIVEFLGIHLGSNSWVLSGTRTKSGKPILANDPHIGYLQPAVWYQAHLIYEDYDLYGFYLPPIPIPLMGQNMRYAWGLTMFANDDHDLYLEIFKPDDTNWVRYRNDWVRVTVETEQIHVRFGNPVTFTRRLTPHGVVVTDAYRSLLDYYGPELALYWVWQHVPYTDMLAFYKMSHAKNIDEFRDGVSLITSPGINVSYADSDGNIAWWVGAKIPIRPEHVNPKYVLDGASGKDEVLGYLPFEHNPHLINPPWGYIVTANNLSTVKPCGEVKELQGYWEPSDRAYRMETLLETRNDWTIEDLRTVQVDHLCVPGKQITQIMVELLSAQQEKLSPKERIALEKLSTWDYQYDTQSIGASIFTVFCDAILRNLLLDDLGEQMFKAYCTVADRWNFFKYIVSDDNSFLWDNRTTPEVEKRKDIFLIAFKETIKVLEKKRGKDMSQWQWGNLHTLEFKHPLGYIPPFRHIFNVGPFPCPGSYHTVNNMPYVAGEYNYEVIAGPSTRRLVDFAQPDCVLEILPTGNSGIVKSPWYRDQAERFIRSEYRPARITKDQIDAHTSATLKIKRQ